MKIKLIYFFGFFMLVACNNSNMDSDAYGNFEANEIVISSEASGRLIKFNIEEGQSLGKGEMVGLVDSLQLFLKKKQLKAQLGLISSKVASVSAQIEVQEKQKENLLREKKRLEKLVKDGAATSRQLDDITGQYDLVLTQIKSTGTQFKIIQDERSALLAQMEQLDDQLNRCKIINPIKGVVLEKYVEPSELVTMGRNLYKIADISQMDLRVYVNGSQIPHLKIGQKVNVLIDESDKDNRSLDGVISWISSSAEFTPKIIQTKEERVKLVYAVIIKVKNDGSIKIGMPGEVIFTSK